MELVSGWVKSGKLSVGDRLPSERELAKTLGINLLTVNKAMARLADAGVISRAAGRGGSHVARMPQKDSIAIVCDMLHLLKSEHRQIDKAVETLMARSSANGYAPHFMPGRGSNAAEFLESLSAGSSVWNEIKGVAAMAWAEGFDERFDEMGIPLVVVSTEDQGRHSVCSDYAELGRIAAEEAMRAGASKICVVLNKHFMFKMANNPVESFDRALAEAGSKAKTSHVPTDELTVEAGERWARHLIPDLKSCDALFITNDNVAEGFARVLANPADDFVPKTILTQASVGLITGLPAHFRRISFDTAETAEAALSMLGGIMRGELDNAAKLQTMLKPRLEATAGESQTSTKSKTPKEKA